MAPNRGHQHGVAAITLLTAPNMGFYVAVVVLALLAATLAPFGYLVIAVIAVFRTRGDPPHNRRPPDRHECQFEQLAN